MQQRSSSSSSRCSGDEHRSININGAQRRRTADDDLLDGLPLYHHRSAAVKRDFPRSRSPEKLIHAIPLLVLLCLFTLWWFSFPGIYHPFSHYPQHYFDCSLISYFLCFLMFLFYIYVQLANSHMIVFNILDCILCLPRV